MSTFENFVQCRVASPITAAATSLELYAAVAPYNLPSDGGGVLVLTDSPGNPSKVEIIRYASRSALGLYGVERGQEGTTAIEWTGPVYCYQALMAGDFQALLDAKVDKVTGKALSANDFTNDLLAKLNQIAEEATKNATDAQLRDRAKHTGEQAISTVTGLAAALNNRVDKEAGRSLLPDTEITRLATMATNATKNRADSANADKVHGHDLATASKAGFMSPDHVLLLSTFGGINNIGKAGNIGFGVGICPSGYPGMSAMAGTVSLGHDNYGNYQYKDGSVMCWVPAFYYRWGNAASPHYAAHGKNACDILPIGAFPSILAAAVAGWPLHRAFWDDGAAQPGVFVDKYKCSNNGGVASSIKGGIPLSSSAANNPFSGLNGSPANIYAGAIDAAKTRGVDFHPTSAFIPNMLHTLSIAHGQAATSSAVCAWYDANGVNNFPKGCNNNALGDANDPSVSYESTGYSNAGKTGSGQPFSKTTHNGQACGVADVNGGIWEICPGLTVQDGNYYILKTSARMADLTSGATVDTDAWGVPAMAKSFDLLGTSHQALGSNIGSNFAIGSSNQVFSNATEGKDWAAAGAGIPNLNGVGGSNLFGNDRFYDNKPQHMCLLACGYWYNATNAGPGARHCNNSRTTSNYSVSFRAALYLARRSGSEGGAL